MPILSFKEECDQQKERKSEHHYSQDREMSRERYGGRDRSRERDDRRSEERNTLSGHTNSNDPKSLMSRVFIGNLPHEKISRDELLETFSKYGKVTAVNMLKGFGFIQYEYEDDARKAVSMETGSILKGSRLDVKMAAEGKKKGGAGRGAPPPVERQSYRDRSPIRERPVYERSRPAARDPYDDQYRARPPPAKDPYDAYRDIRRDAYADPYATRDPYQTPRDAYASVPVRDPYPLPSVKPVERPPVDCEVTVLDRLQRDYADGIERRLKTHGMLTFVNVLPSEDLLVKAQDDISKRRIPFNIVVSPLNQQHRSITVRILHGTPQEHRNMPLEDALKLVTSNFEVYLRNVRSGKPTSAPVQAVTGGGPEDFVQADGQTSYLLNLLADNRFLTLDELNTVLRYLTDRRDQLMVKQGLNVPKQTDTSNEEAALAQQQQELQAKILSVLGGTETTPASSALQQLSGYNNSTSAAGYGDLTNASTLLGNAGGIVTNAGSLLDTNTVNGARGGGYNLSTPGVQQALDNLISNSGNLLQNLGGVSAQDATANIQAATTAQASMYQGYASYPNY